MRPTPGTRSLPSTVLDAEFFPKKSDFALRLLELGLEPTATGSAAPGDSSFSQLTVVAEPLRSPAEYTRFQPF
jgi:hypothetical protein